jgi:hypothetical protein
MTSNNINVELRPGTRLVRETNGNREIMWVEEDYLGGTRRSFWGGLILLTVFFFLAVFIFGGDVPQVENTNAPIEQVKNKGSN